MYYFTQILEGLQQKLGELQPLSWRRHCFPRIIQFEICL